MADRPGAGVDQSVLPVAFRTLGCKVNQVESEDIAADLLGRAVRVVTQEHAAVIVVNTCTVTAEADRKARKAIRRALALPSAPTVVVTGCMAAVDPSVLEALGERVVVEADKERVADRVAALVGALDEPHEHAVRAGTGFHTRAMLKVEDGCDNFCTYCIVPHARGLPRSVPLEDVLAEARALVAAGVPEIVVTGINVGRYADVTTGADLADLIVALGETGVGRLRLSSVEPPDLTERLLTAVAATPVFAPHLHVPLQSGSDAVLAGMGRAYAVAEYEERIRAARAALPGLALTTDVLVGFPGETLTHAEETLATLERIGFAKLHVFRYSRRPGTPAADRDDQVASGDIAARAESVRCLGDRMRGEWLDARIGAPADVLVERVGSGTAEGTTAHYEKVRIGLLAHGDAHTPRVGETVRVVCGSRIGEVLLAAVC